MRAEVHSGEPDQDRDWKTREADTAAREDQNTKKCGRRENMTGGKRVIFRAKPRTTPAQLRFHGRASPRNGAFDDAPGKELKFSLIEPVPLEGDGCILFEGSGDAVDLRKSWFGSPMDPAAEQLPD